jgi:hypothetical protein
MMTRTLTIYLHDHLAGSVFEVELVEELARDAGELRLADQAKSWESEIKADQETLREILRRLDASTSSAKDVITWIAEKAARLKLRRQSHGELGLLETLETLALGILGKQKLWRLLHELLGPDRQFADIDFNGLIQRADAQHESVEANRLELARKVFARPTRPL